MNDEVYKLLEQAYYLLDYLNSHTNNMADYFNGVREATQLVAEVLDKLKEHK